jgi:hypothetical protein
MKMGAFENELWQALCANKIAAKAQESSVRSLDIGQIVNEYLLCTRHWP